MSIIMNSFSKAHVEMDSLFLKDLNQLFYQLGISASACLCTGLLLAPKEIDFG